MELTTALFREAFASQVAQLKPDPLARKQMENLRLDWEHADEGTDAPLMAMGLGISLECYSCNSLRSLCGMLCFTSEYISITISAECNEKESERNDDDGPDFENEFSIKLKVNAACLPFKPPTKEHLDRKELQGKRRLHAAMIERLESDPLIRRLIHAKDGILLCEALIQENSKSNIPAGSGKAPIELEERVNVNEKTLDGIRKAVFSHCEDNLDVLTILLDMPYFLRQSSDIGEQRPKAAALAKRAYLRLLEDALFDACEREGEDEMLDELTISEDKDAQGERNEGGGKRRC